MRKEKNVNEVAINRLMAKINSQKTITNGNDGVFGEIVSLSEVAEKGEKAYQNVWHLVDAMPTLRDLFKRDEIDFKKLKRELIKMLKSKVNEEENSYFDTYKYVLAYQLLGAKMESLHTSNPRISICVKISENGRFSKSEKEAFDFCKLIDKDFKCRFVENQE